MLSSIILYVQATTLLWHVAIPQQMDQFDSCELALALQPYRKAHLQLC